MTIAVFLAEDMKAVREAIAELLMSAGDFQVVGMAATEAEGKLWLEEHRGGWDLAVIDLVLAQGTGMGVLAKACETHPKGHAIVFSDYSSPGIRQHCLSLGATAVFQKSTDMAKLLDYCAGMAA